MSRMGDERREARSEIDAKEWARARALQWCDCRPPRPGRSYMRYKACLLCNKLILQVQRITISEPRWRL